MPNITLSIDEELLRSSREYAKSHNDTLNGLVRRLLTQAVLDGDAQWLDECFALMDRAQGRSGGRTWRREDLYDADAPPCLPSECRCCTPGGVTKKTRKGGA